MQHTYRIVAAALLLGSTSAFAQLPVLGFSGGGGGTRDGGSHGNATIQLPMRWLPWLLGAPYSGEEVDETVQTMADGGHITQNVGFHQKAWRDSQGRIRLEQPLLASAGRLGKSVPVLVEIQDPVAGYIYILDSTHRITHRIRVPAPNVPGHKPSQMLPPPAGPGSLGTQLFDGVEAYGTRTSTVIPAGSQGNDAPLTTTHEQWFAPQLQLNVLSIDTFPGQGTTTRKVVNLSRIEPDPTLFYPPADYTVVDENDTFTIQWEVH